ncbi:MAG: DUF1801 domain-containing protein [Paracoccaceae bacterium]
MAANKTVPAEISAAEFIAGVEPPERRAEAGRLDAIFRAATGWAPRLWGPSIVGYGRYAYTYASGHSGEMCATGFSPRKAELSIYILPGYQDYGAILADLGRHRTGKSCLYVRRLSDIDEAVLKRLIAAGVADLARRWPVTAD